MCLLINQKEGYSFTDKWLEDFYSYNPDGIGVMWAADGTINICKLVPNTIQDLKDFYKDHVAGKACALHFRWRTHGATDILNCHPYEVFGEAEGYPIYLMHNGVLSTGNKADVEKSDTWHYINDYIRPALKADPTQFMAPWFKEFIETHINSSNKFVMMDALGNTVTFNETAGVMFEGNWMSNTYAWTTPKAIPKLAAIGYGDGFKSDSGYENYDYGYGYGNSWYDSYTPAPVPEESLSDVESYTDTLMEVLESLQYHYALSSIDDTTIIAFYQNEGEYAAWQYLDDLEDGNYSEFQVCSHFTSHSSWQAGPEKLAVGML